MERIRTLGPSYLYNTITMLLYMHNVISIIYIITDIQISHRVWREHMAPPDVTHRGVWFKFEMKDVTSSDVVIRAMHYTRYQFDPLKNKGKSILRPEDLIVEHELTCIEDCKIDEKITALTRSGNDMAKCMAELVQNSIDTTLVSLGGTQTGGWGDGLKMAIARSLKMGASFSIVTLSGVDCNFHTSIEAKGPVLISQNAHETKKFTDASVYIGYSTKPSKTSKSSNSISDMVKQMECVESTAYFDTSPTNYLKDWGDGSFCVTTAILEYHSEPCPITMNMPWVVILSRHLASIKGVSSNKYVLLKDPNICISVEVHEYECDRMQITFFQNGIFVYVETLRATDRVGFESIKWTGDIIISFTSNLPISNTRDRSLDMNNISAMLSNLLNKSMLFDEILAVCFVRDVLFDQRFMFTISSKSSSKVAIFVDSFVMKFKDALRTKWNPKIIPVSSLVEAELVDEVLGDTWTKVFTLECYRELFSRVGLLNLSTVTAREEKASTYAITQMEDLQEIVDVESIRIDGVFVLPYKRTVVRSLINFGVFRDQHVNDRCVCLGTASILYKNKIYVPSDFAVTWESVDCVLDSLRIITSAHNSAIRKERALQNKEIKKLTKTDGKLAVAKPDKGKIKITSESQLSRVLKLSTTSRFGPGEDMELDGDGMSTFFRYSITLRNRDEQIVLTKCSETVSREDEKIDLMYLLKCATTEFSEPKPNPCAASHVDRILEGVLRFSSTNMYKFTDSEPHTFDQIKAYVFSTGHCGYISTHNGNLDNPYQTLNCMSSSLRLGLLLMRLGYTCYVYRNGHHAFIGVSRLLRGYEETLIECTVANVGSFHRTANQRIREIITSHKRLRDADSVPNVASPKFPKKRRMFLGSQLQCFCNEEYPPIYPEDPRTDNCVVCNRLFHVMCAEDRVQHDGTRVCLVCIPNDKGCPCKRLFHFKGHGRAFSGKWIGCASCDRWLHSECVKAEVDEYECTHDGYECIESDK